jgi:uncharacterized protein involved in type VI secretion and phage assembly
MPTPSFKLTVDGTELTLVEFDGEEELNRLFKYTFKTEIPSSGKIADVIDGDAIFTIVEFDSSLHSGDIEIPGYISKASKTSNEWVLEFRPKLNKTTTNSRSEIYFKEDASLTALTVIQSEFDNDIYLNDRTPVFDISGTLPSRKLFCQFQESNWNYVARLCDHWGFHFYFDHYSSQIVFANNEQYDQKFLTQLKTTSSTAVNSQLKIVDWLEAISPTESYTTIVGYDYENAGTTINASHPTNGPSQSVLTESSQTLSDVNSQAEADYISQIRQEATNCKNHLASGKAKIPYLMPGLLIDTDDSDFSKAFVIKTVNRARNLNSTNSGTAANFICEFEAIPDDICFRPNPHYEVPTATNVFGKIISETDEINQAQRNGSGEYKAELLGFENESSVHPWLRKAQTTASNNSVDMPLTPNTEVLISFYDNNPNCPFIQHALDNSLHPSPVTNANPHHAIISTHGMLVTSSLEGRFNNAITPQTSGSGYKGVSTANYFTGRGDFDQHANFIDPSATNADFTADDKDSGNLIFTQHKGDFVEVREGDKLNWHNGNIYDFGGYWNYNLGNSYEENFIDQEAPLNIKVNKDSRSGDILTNNGPDWSSINFDAIKKHGLSTSDVTPDSYGDSNIDTDRSGKTFKVNTGGKWNSGGMNVTKDYNASYDYKFGEGIEISDRVNSLEITHTDGDTTAIEMNFHKGVLRSWGKQVGRNTDEKKWAGNGDKTFEASSSFDSSTNTKTEKETAWDVKGDTKISDSSTITTPNSITTDEKSFNMDTGALSTHNIKTTNGMATAEMDFSFDASAASKFNFGASTSFSLSAQAEASIAVSLSGAVKIELEASLLLSIKANAALTIEIEADGAGKIELNNGKFEYSGNGIGAKMAQALCATKKVTDLEKAEIAIYQNMMDITDKMMALDKCNVKLNTNYVCIFS